MVLTDKELLSEAIDASGNTIKEFNCGNNQKIQNTDNTPLKLYQLIVIEEDSQDKLFSPDRQIQPASIDLKLSRKIWRSTKKFNKNIDFLDNMSLVISKYWQEETLQIDQAIKIRPKETIFSRTHELISIPNNCIGLIENKSSLARLGLSITFSKYCNPKYCGHFPLQITNNSNCTIVLYPHIEICQLILLKLNDDVRVNYDAANRESLYSKYDDGGPTKFWASKHNKQIRETLCKNKVYKFEDSEINELDGEIEKTFKQDAEKKEIVYVRFHKYFLKHYKKKNDKSVLKGFLERERSKHAFLQNYLKGSTQTILTIFIILASFFGGLFTYLLSKPDLQRSIFLIFIFAILLIVALVANALLAQKMQKYVDTLLVDIPPDTQKNRPH